MHNLHLNTYNGDDPDVEIEWTTFAFLRLTVSQPNGVEPFGEPAEWDDVACAFLTREQATQIRDHLTECLQHTTTNGRQQ